MGGSLIEDEWELTIPSSRGRTIVLFGRTGNGKSATGNSILGREAFESMMSASSVTSSCKLGTTVMKDGQIVNVIDTSGLFDPSVDHNGLSKEIVHFVKMARNGIDAVILVLSVGNGFTEEEQSAVRRLPWLFGAKIIRYMIVVFTGGDRLGNRQTLDDYLGRFCTSPLKEVLELCENRTVLFDNQTKDEVKRIQQVNQLMKLVQNVVVQNGGLPYTNELFIEMQKQAAQLKLDSLTSKSAANQELIDLKEEIKKSEEQLELITEMLTAELKEQLKAEEAARWKAEVAREIEELRKQVAAKGSCSIL